MVDLSSDTMCQNHFSLMSEEYKPQDIVEKQLLVTAPDDLRFVQAFKAKAATVDPRKKHELIRSLVNYVMQTAAIKVQAIRMLWTGIFFIRCTTHTVYWIAAGRIKKISGICKSSIPIYLKKIGIFESYYAGDYKSDLIKFLTVFRLQNSVNRWIRYDTWVPSKEEAENVENTRRYLLPNEGVPTFSAVVCQPSPIMTIEDQYDGIQIVPEEQRIDVLWNRVHCFDQRQEDLRFEEELQTGLTGFEQVQYRIEHQSQEAAQELQDAIAAIQAGPNAYSRLRVWWQFMHAPGSTSHINYRTRMLWGGCYEGFNTPCWLNLERISALTGVKERIIKDFLLDIKIKPTQPRESDNNEGFYSYLAEFDMSQEGWVAFREVRSCK